MSRPSSSTISLHYVAGRSSYAHFSLSLPLRPLCPVSSSSMRIKHVQATRLPRMQLTSRSWRGSRCARWCVHAMFSLCRAQTMARRQILESRAASPRALHSYVFLITTNDIASTGFWDDEDWSEDVVLDMMFGTKTEPLPKAVDNKLSESWLALAEDYNKVRTLLTEGRCLVLMSYRPVYVLVCYTLATSRSLSSFKKWRRPEGPSPHFRQVLDMLYYFLDCLLVRR